MSTSTHGHGPIAITVAPAQSAYFAGEPFSFTITFANTTNPAQSNTNSPRTAAFAPGHHRAAHSISSAPLARPPTSPGTPKTLSRPQSPAPSDSAALRKGLVGHRHQGPRSPATNGKQKGLSKSLSVNVSTPHEIISKLASGGDSKASPIASRAGIQCE